MKTQTQNVRNRFRSLAPAKGITARQGVAPTTAVSLFAILSGVGGALGQLISGYRLRDYSGNVSFLQLALPVVVSIAGTAIGAGLLPSGTSSSAVARSVSR